MKWSCSLAFTFELRLKSYDFKQFILSLCVIISYHLEPSVCFETMFMLILLFIILPEIFEISCRHAGSSIFASTFIERTALQVLLFCYMFISSVHGITTYTCKIYQLKLLVFALIIAFCFCENISYLITLFW